MTKQDAPTTTDADHVAFETWHRSQFATKYDNGHPTRDKHNGKYDEKYNVPEEQTRWNAFRAGIAHEAAQWANVKDALPSCRDDQEYIGINTAGFAGVFNAVQVVNGNTYCLMETAEESVSIMSDLDIWKPFIRPAPPTKSDDAMEVSNGL